MVRILDVGPRDGLQSEQIPIPTELKLAYIEALTVAGIKEIEATSFVSPKWVPQLADAEALSSQLDQNRALFSALVPNDNGLERALASGYRRMAFFTAASDAFSQKNMNCSVEESLGRIESMIASFRKRVPGGWVRTHISTCFECPYSGHVPVDRVVEISRRLIEIGVDEIGISDTIGVAAPPEVSLLLEELLKQVPVERVACHFHDTRGTALANVYAAYELGVRTFDASSGGLGGCPYSPGAAGNLATEDLVYMLERIGEPTGVDLKRLSRASLPVLEHLGRKPFAKAQIACLAASAGTS